MKLPTVDDGRARDGGSDRSTSSPTSEAPEPLADDPVAPMEAPEPAPSAPASPTEGSTNPVGGGSGDSPSGGSSPASPRSGARARTASTSTADLHLHLHLHHLHLRHLRSFRRLVGCCPTRAICSRTRFPRWRRLSRISSHRSSATDRSADAHPSPPSSRARLVRGRATAAARPPVCRHPVHRARAGGGDHPRRRPQLHRDAGGTSGYPTGEPRRHHDAPNRGAPGRLCPTRLRRATARARRALPCSSRRSRDARRLPRAS